MSRQCRLLALGAAAAMARMILPAPEAVPPLAAAPAAPAARHPASVLSVLCGAGGGLPVAQGGCWGAAERRRRVGG
jgi:hypothetical protein